MNTKSPATGRSASARSASLAGPISSDANRPCSRTAQAASSSLALGERIDLDDDARNSKAERRLAAILVVDVVGFSRMVGVDEAGTLRRLKALRLELIDPAIRLRGGRLVKSTGDGVLVDFPSALNAVMCAVSIQQSMPARNGDLPDVQAFRLRIGINVGDVFIEPDGDVYGDGVNVAARLEALSVPGGFCVSRTVYDQVRDKLALAFEDGGKQELKNIARPVGIFRVSAAAVAAHALEPGGASAAPRRLEPKRFVATALIALFLGAGLSWWYWPNRLAPPAAATPVSATDQVPTPPPLSMVVLPFANVSDDPEQEFFADGLTDDLTTDLSHLAGSFVISRSTAFTYKGKPSDAKRIGRELGVRYVLEGSVRRVGDRVVVNADLVAAETGGQIWSDRFEGDRSRLGSLQADFVARLARSMDVQLTQAESLRSLRERPNDPNASDLAMRGWGALNRPISSDSLDEAVADFRKALAIDADSLQALIGLPRALMIRVQSRISADRTADMALAESTVDRALASDPENAMARLVKAQVLAGRHQFTAALATYEAAIDSDRNLAPAYAYAGLTKIYLGRSVEASPLIETAIRLSPKDPLIGSWEYLICHADSHQAQWDAAIAQCNRAASDAPRYWMPYVDLASANAWNGHGAEAKDAVDHLLKLMPGYTVSKWANADWSQDPTFLAEYARITEGLRKAGLPNG